MIHRRAYNFVRKSRATIPSLLGALLLLATVTNIQAAPRTVMVHLFEWKWPDVARECEVYLGPKGFAAVQVSPPAEHIPGSQWWTRYQPVGYKIISRSGSEAEFDNMVQRCTNAGVDVYVDLVINHSPGRVSPNDTKTGIAGTKYGHYWVENLFNFSDYNDCKQDITNYNDAVNVQYCDLVELMDLRTGSTYVRGKIADYMKHLLGKGVKGFRIDAAKHIPDADLNAIVSSVRQDYPNFYVFQEVIDISTTEAVDSGQYLYVGDVTEFIYSAEVGRVFRHGKLAWLEALGEGWQQGGSGQAMMNSASAVVFVDNHDNQRGHGAGGADIITHKDGQLYDLANVFMLAWPYGYPKVMSSFAFGHSDQDPPSSTIYSGPTDTTANCFQEWQCEHRWRPIGNMVAFRNQTASAFNVSNWWSNGNNQIAFGRGDKGFVVINKEPQNLDRWFETGLPEGTYCDVISGEKSGGSCTGKSISVQADGWAHIPVDVGKANAIHAGAKL